MAGQILNYAYVGTNGNTYYGQVVADPTNPKYNYEPGHTYIAPGGIYAIGSTAGVATSAPVGSVYQTAYTEGATGTSYDSYHYDPATNMYYDVKTLGYDINSGKYTPPGSATGVPMWSTTQGLGSEYGYVKTTDGKYHVYGGGGTANAQITPSTTGLVAYDYQFLYPDGSYYDGKVYDDGSYGYKVGQLIPKGTDGTYNLYAQDPTKPTTDALAGQTYTSLYHEGATGTNYPPSDIIPGTPYYQKPVGYGGLGTEQDYAAKPNGYYLFDHTTPASASTPVTAIPLPA